MTVEEEDGTDVEEEADGGVDVDAAPTTLAAILSNPLAIPNTIANAHVLNTIFASPYASSTFEPLRDGCCGCCSLLLSVCMCGSAVSGLA